jgi:predicted histone-like DNA-binding protein
MYKFHVVPRKNPQTGAVKYYGTGTRVSPVNVSRLVEEISASCTLTRADVKAALVAIEEVILRYIRDGHSVRFGDLGSFRLNIQSKGSDTEEDFTLDLIQSARIRFAPSAWMRNAINVKNPSMKFMRVQNKVRNPTTEETPETPEDNEN